MNGRPIAAIAAISLESLVQQSVELAERVNQTMEADDVAVAAPALWLLLRNRRLRTMEVDLTIKLCDGM